MPRQTDLRYTFDSADASAFEVVAFRLSEGFSEPYLLEGRGSDSLLTGAQFAPPPQAFEGQEGPMVTIEMVAKRI